MAVRQQDAVKATVQAIALVGKQQGRSGTIAIQCGLAQGGGECSHFCIRQQPHDVQHGRSLRVAAPVLP